jgi:hypothetical protein
MERLWRNLCSIFLFFSELRGSSYLGTSEEGLPASTYLGTTNSCTWWGTWWAHMKIRAESTLDHVLLSNFVFHFLLICPLPNLPGAHQSPIKAKYWGVGNDGGKGGGTSIMPCPLCHVRFINGPSLAHHHKFGMNNVPE